MPTYTVQQSCVCILKFLTSKLKYRTQPCCIAYAACVPSNDRPSRMLAGQLAASYGRVENISVIERPLLKFSPEKA